MDLQNLPYRSMVIAWSPDDLADYFKKLKYKDCEKVIRKHNINGQRFLSMSENDIQKFPKLSMPIVSKLSQEINRNEGRMSFFPKRSQTQKFADNTGGCDEEEEGWSSFEEDDYESPDDEQDNDADYESPTDEPGHESDDYEPPPSNNDIAPHNVIFPAKSIPSNTDYIDRPTNARPSPQPPIPPQRPGPSPGAAPYAGRGTPMPPYPPPSSNNDVNRDKSAKPLKPPAPSIDRRTKPPLDRSGPPFESDSPGPGKRAVFPDKPMAPQLKTLVREQLAKIQKPPIPSADKYERGNPVSGRKPSPAKPGWAPERRYDEEDEPTSQRSMPQQPLPPFSSNTFPARSGKPPPKHIPSGSKSMPGSYADSTNNISSSGSLPPRFQQGNINRAASKGPADVRPPLPIPNRQIVQPPSMEEDEDSLNTEWYAADISRQEAEASLRKINKDGTFLVRDSSRKTNTHPYVLMVLYKDKVYNIQIRYQEQNQVYLLGTGLKGKEDFSSVAEIIAYFQRTPLLLIDGKDRGSRNQCMLTYAAGYM